MNASAAVAAVIRTRAEFSALAGQWDALPQARENPLFSHRWLAAAADAFHEDGELHVVTLCRDGRLLAAAPLATIVRAGVSRLEFIGASVLHEPAALLAEDAAALRALCGALVDARRPLVLQRVAPESGLRPALQEAARGRGFMMTVQSAPCLRVENPGSWEAYLAGRSSEVRGGLRRKRALLERDGTVAFDALRPGAADLAQVLAEAFEVEADGWKSASGTAIRSNAALGRFVEGLAARFAENGQLRVCFLRAGPRALAMAILLEYAHRLWEIKIGYRESAGRASPGRLLLWETLRDAFGRGLLGYEFLGSGDRQQPDWATGATSLETLAYYPWTAAGFRALATDAATSLGRKLRR